MRSKGVLGQGRGVTLRLGEEGGEAKAEDDNQSKSQEESSVQQPAALREIALTNDQWVAQ